MNTDSEYKFVTRMREWYDGSLDMDQSNGWRKRARKAIDFYRGTGQWEDAVRSRLVAEGRPVLTINKILPTINVVWGQQLKNQTEIRIEARKGGFNNVADLASSLIEHAMSTCGGYDAAGDAFRDGLIAGKGWLSIDHVFDNDPKTGELVVDSVSPLLIYEDPRAQGYDVNDGEFIFRERFVTKNRFKAMFPRQYKDAIAASHDDWANDGNTGGQGKGFVAFMRQLFSRQAASRSADGEMRGVIVRECWFKTYSRTRTAFLSSDGEPVTEGRIRNRQEQADLMQAVSEWPGLEVDIRDGMEIRIDKAVMVGDLLVTQERNALNGCRLFPYVRYSPFWMHGEPMGLVDNLIDPQFEYNKQRSNMLHLQNVAGNPAWRAKRASLKGAAIIQQYGSTPGVLVEEDDFGGKIERIEADGVSNADEMLAQRAEADIRDISGANPDVLGTTPEQSESGRARLIRQEAGQTTLAPVVGNFFRSNAILGKTIWEYVRHNGVYSAEEVLAIVDDETLADLGGPFAAVEMMNRWDVGTYGVKAISAKTSATWRDAQLEELQQFTGLVSSMGMQLPPDVNNQLLVKALKLSSFPGSDKIAERLEGSPAMPAMPELPGGQGTKQGTRRGAVVAAAG